MKKYFITTAIDYPNSRPHIGTAFEKIGADVQARYRRMEGYDVHFLMGNDENTVKVARRAAELGRERMFLSALARWIWNGPRLVIEFLASTVADEKRAGGQMGRRIAASRVESVKKIVGEGVTVIRPIS